MDRFNPYARRPAQDQLAVIRLQFRCGFEVQICFAETAQSGRDPLDLSSNAVQIDERVLLSIPILNQMARSADFCAVD